MNKPTVLVVGGAGYIGSHTCKALNLKGYNPVVFDNLSTGFKDVVKWGDLFLGDILKPAEIKTAIEKYKPSAVVHFAAFAYVGESVTNPSKYYYNNVVGSLNLIDVCKNEGNIPIVFSSTCATYGEPQSIPITEDHPQNPINPYGFTKLIVEKILEDYSKAYGLSSIRLRYFNAAGADFELETGEKHNPETHLIPLAIMAALDPNKTIRVFGTDYPTADGTAIRDYIHVLDLAEAHILAIEKLLNYNGNGFSEFYNLGNGNGFSVNQIIEEVKIISGNPIQVIKEGRREGDPAVLIGSSVKIKKELGWQPKYDQISKIIESAFTWHKRYG